MMDPELAAALAEINTKLESIEDLRKDVRALRIDIQDLHDRNRHAITAGTVTVLNEDISGLRDDNREIRARLAVLEQKLITP
jgi:predicted  nucleic acid-binding Zn-ribbon protein